MRNVFTLLMICFFSFKSYALNEDFKPAAVADQPKVRKTNGNIIVDPPSLKADNDKLIFCEGKPTTLTAAGGDGKYQWYHDDILIQGVTSNQLIIDKPGKYQVISINIKSNALNIGMYTRLSKPTITFIE